MRRLFTLAMLLFLLLYTTVLAQGGPSMSIVFITLGNCSICQLRIETAVNSLPGIISVDWSISGKQTSVTYDESVTDPYTIMHVIANVGHDNEWFEAPDSAYNLLVGSCCEYERTIDYSNVQVGYLSLMGIWIFPTGMVEQTKTKFNVYPTSGTGIFRFTSMGSQMPDNLMINVYSIQGTKMLTCSDVNNSNSSIDLGCLPNGPYLVCFLENKQIISSNRVIKIQ